jgi:hypothetical protein
MQAKGVCDGQISNRARAHVIFDAAESIGSDCIARPRHPGKRFFACAKRKKALRVWSLGGASREIGSRGSSFEPLPLKSGKDLGFRV